MTERFRIGRLGALAVALVLILTAAACGGDDDEGGDGGDGGGGGDAAQGEYGEVKIVLSGATVEDKIPQSGAWRFGPEFGFADQDASDIQAIESHATASQLFLSGRADVMEGTFIVAAQLVQEGQDVRAFCPEEIDTLEHLVGVGIDDIADITDPDIRVGVDSPGGLINYLMNHVFRAKGLTNEDGEPLITDDLENVKILEDGGLRLAALAQDEIDVGSLDLFEQAQLEKQVGGTEEDFALLSVTAQDIEDAVGSVFIAKKEWIDEDPDRAAAFCATILKATRTLATDVDEYLEWAEDVSALEFDEKIQREVWAFSRENGVWPYDGSILNPDTVATDLEVLVDSGLLEEAALDLEFEDIVDTGPSEQATEMVGGPADDVSDLE
jgi:ABC-type nitrate/sulfonate/bicarbonate transport system substrate-binding protein